MAKLSAKNQIHYNNALPKLQSADWAEVQAGIAQIAALNIPILLRHLASGITQRRGVLKIKAGCWVEATVDAAHRKNAALWIAVASGKLDAVVSLDLRGYSHIPALGRLSALRQLWLDASVTDLSVLAGLTLDDLYMTQTHATDLRPLGSLSALKSLNLTGATDLTDLTGLAAVPGLQNLYLTNTEKVTDLSPLAGAALASLSLTGSAVSDLSALASMSGLTSLDLQNAKATSLTSSVPLPQVQKLLLNGARCTSLPILAQTPNLTWLDADSTALASLEDVAALPGLQHLSLRGCKQITDFAPLARLTALTYLRLWETEINDPAPLAGLVELTYLDLDTTRIRDVAALYRLSKLATLDIRRCPDLTDQTLSRPWTGSDVAPLLARFAPAPA